MEEENISKLLLEIRNIEKTVNNINVQINNNLDDITKKKTLVEERQALKAIMKQENRSMLDKKKNIMECINEKARLYESMFPSEDTIDMYQCSKTTHLSDSLGNMTFYCVDPGVRTMATCVQMNAEDTSSYLSLSLGHPDLLNFFKTEEGKARLNHLLKPCETTVTAKSISAKSRTSYYRFKLQQRKNSNSDIASIENKLVPYGKHNKSKKQQVSCDQKHQMYKEIQGKMLEFYCYSSWTRRKNRGQRRFKDKTYSTSARKIVKNADTEKNVVFYGDSGRGHGLWIKGYEKRSTDTLQKSLSSRSTVLSTTECRSSKLCCIYDEPVVHPKNNGKVNLGAVLCVNPDCIGRQNSYAIKSRDTNTAVNILKTGLYRVVTKDDHPSFSRKMKKEDASKKLFMVRHNLES